MHTNHATPSAAPTPCPACQSRGHRGAPCLIGVAQVFPASTWKPGGGDVCEWLWMQDGMAIGLSSNIPGGKPWSAALLAIGDALDGIELAVGTGATAHEACMALRIAMDTFCRSLTRMAPPDPNNVKVTIEARRFCHTCRRTDARTFVREQRWSDAEVATSPFLPAVLRRHATERMSADVKAWEDYFGWCGCGNPR